MKEADSSWRTSTNLILSLRSLSASIKPLMPSPGNPNIVSTPQSSSDSATMSAVFVPSSAATMRYYMCPDRIIKLTTQIRHSAFGNSFDDPCKRDIVVAYAVDVVRHKVDINAVVD